MSNDVYAANRRLEMAFLLNRMNLQDRLMRADTLRLCHNCLPEGNHECTKRALAVTMVYDTSDHGKDRAESKEVPCQCYFCNVAAEHPDGS